MQNAKKAYGVLLLVLVIRILFYYFSQEKIADGVKVRITQSVKSEPLRFETSQYVKLSGLKVYLPPFPVITYGDKVIVEGVKVGDKLENPTLVKVFESDNFIFKVRNKLLEFYKSTLPEPHSSLVAGVVLGSKSQIPRGFYDSLINSGTVHVVVASGMNVSLVAGFALGLFALFVTKKQASVLVIVFIWFYALLSGFDAPIIRASIMGSIAFLAVALGKISLAGRSLIATAFVMLLIRPDWIGDLGFILSFVATLSLILFERKVGRLLYRIPKIVRGDLATTLAAQIGVFPILLVSFGRFNPLSIIANAAVLWTIPLITVLGMIAGVVGLLVPSVGKIVLFATFPLTSWFVGVVKIFG